MTGPPELEKVEKALGWSPGRTHWWMTTVVAIVAVVVGITSLVMTFFYAPNPPPTTIDSATSEFMKLSYADRIDRCQPYIRQHLDDWQSRWRAALRRTSGDQLKDPVGFAALDDVDATGQALVDTHLAIVNYAEKLAPTDEGRNLLSCVYTPAFTPSPGADHLDADALVGNGNEVPKADNVVVRESAVYDQGEFAGITAEGRANKIVEVIIRPGRSEGHRELGFVMVAGHEQGVQMWALMASVNGGDRDWMNDVQDYRGS